jgi:hypothetical protein
MFETAGIDLVISAFLRHAANAALLKTPPSRGRSVVFALFFPA